MTDNEELIGTFESCEAFEDHLARVLGMAPMEHGSFYVRGNHHDSNGLFLDAIYSLWYIMVDE